MNIEVAKEACFHENNDSMLECENNFQIIDLTTSSALLDFEDELSDETEIFSMTSLGTLVFLGQRETQHSLQNLSESGESAATMDDGKRLTLAYERLHYIPRALIERFAPSIHTLDISHNNFSKLDFLTDFTYLTSLIADHNDITSDTVIPYLPKLELLWLNYCKIEELFPWARKLQQACPHIKHLSLMGNMAAPSYLNGGTFYEYLQYRLFMISLFPDLVHLDDCAVTANQRAEAERLYKRPLFERIRPKIQALETVTNQFCDLFQDNLPSFVKKNRKNNVI